MYEVQVIKGRGEKRSKAATCTKYIAASYKPFPSGLLRLPAPSWGASNADHAKPIHPTNKKTPVPYFYQETYLARIQKRYTSYFYAYQSPCLLCLLKF